MKQRRTNRGKLGGTRRTTAQSQPQPQRQAQLQPHERGLDLSSLFGVAAQALAANQSTLNQADTENQNHGDNMVQAFNMITQVLGSQQGGTPSQQLNHASQYLAQNGNSGSAHVYSQGLAQAAQQMQGQNAVTPNNAGMLIEALLGGGQGNQPTGGADMLTSLLTGGQSSQPAQSQQGGMGDLLGSLLGGGQQSGQGGAGDLIGSLLGGGGMQQQQQQQQQDNGLDIGDVINAGMTFMNAKQQGQSTLQAALSAIMASGPMAQKPYRQQSGSLVANALMQAIAGMSRR